MTVPVTLDGFEDGDVDEWTDDAGSIAIVNTPTWSGSHAAEGSRPGVDDPRASVRPAVIGKPTTFTFFYRETSTNTAGGVNLFDADETYMVGAGTDNPEYQYSSGSATDAQPGGQPSETYDVWVKVTFAFDWGAGDVTISWEPQTGTGDDSVTTTLGSTNQIAEVSIGPPDGDAGQMTEFYIDDLQYEPRLSRVKSKGWHTAVFDPDTGRVHTADALADPQIEPSINSLPRINYPVPRAAFWQDLTGTPPMAVFLDAAEQPIDELINVMDKRGQAASVLVGRGGVELLDTAEVEFSSEYRHTAAQTVIQDHTTYDDDIATPSFDTLDDEDMQDPSTTAEFNAVTDFADDFPAEVGTDEVNPLQTAFFAEAENPDSETGGRGTTGSEDDDYSNDAGEVLETNGDRREYDITPDHTIPSENVGIKVRMGLDSGSQTMPAFTWTLGGSAVDTLNTSGTSIGPLGWRDIGDGIFDGDGYQGGDLTAGQTVTLAVEIDDSGDAADIYPFDGVVVYDDRRNHDSARTGNDFDNDTGANSYLDDPRLFGAIDIEFLPATTPFALVAGTVSVTMDATDVDQRVQIRNGVDATYKPDDGTEDNTASVTVDPFASAGDRIQLRVRSSSHSPSGAQSATPRFGYAGQSIQSYDLDADIEQTALLLDYRKDGSVEDILTDIVGESFVWSYRIDGGTETVTVTQPGQRTTDARPGLIEADPEKDLDTYHQVDVQGGNKTVSGFQFTASLSLTDVGESDLIPGEESVRDPDDGTQFDRGEDYTMDYSAGELAATTDGGLVIGDTYEISYAAETKGSFTDPNAPAGHRTLTVDLPEVTSTRNAEQIAYVLVQDLKDPRWAIPVTIPPSVTDFDVVEALSLGQLDIPSDAGPFFVSEPPRLTPRGTEFRLVSQYESQRRVQQIRRQVSSVVRRS